MIRIRSSIAVIVVAAWAAGSAAPALADFQLYGVGGSTMPARDRDDAGRPASRFKLAYGFGRNVPLTFAVRQIVPKAVAVQFGKGVDRSAAVSWRGGASWNRVLARAVHPLGLHVVTGVATVLISR